MLFWVRMFGRERVLFAWAAPLTIAWLFPGVPAVSKGMAPPVVSSVARSLRHWNVPVTISEFAERGPGSAAGSVAWSTELAPLHFKNPNTNTNPDADITLYAKDGTVDPTAVEAFDDLVAKDGKVHKISERTIQLVVKAAYHFHAKEVVIISAYRPKRRRDHGPHTTGTAIDFQLPGVAARTLAAYLRKEPRAGVGIYTNPRTQFVHVDAREQSYHWLDASPPGVVWREKGLSDPDREARDASYTPERDLPEHAPPL